MSDMTDALCYWDGLKSIHAKRSTKRHRLDTEAIREDRAAGMTWAAIGEKHGCSKELLRQISQGLTCGNHHHAFSKKRCIYSGLRKWLNENLVTLEDLASQMPGWENERNGANRLRYMLRGATRITKADIDAVLKVTGLTYEEAFREDEG